MIKEVDKVWPSGLCGWLHLPGLWGPSDLGLGWG